VQQGIVTVSQEDKVILEGEKFGGLYKLKERNSLRGGVSRISLKGSSSRGGASRKTATGREPDQSVAEKRGCTWARPEMAQAITVNQPKAPGRGGKSLMLHGTVTTKEKNQGINPKSQVVLLKV